MDLETPEISLSDFPHLDLPYVFDVRHASDRESAAAFVPRPEFP